MVASRKIAALALGIWVLLGAPAMAQSTGPTTLRMVSHADIKILDPIWTTALITRNFGYMIYDVLFAKDADLKIQPQMAEKYTVSDDRRSWRALIPSASAGVMGRRWTVPPSASTTSASHLEG